MEAILQSFTSMDHTQGCANERLWMRQVFIDHAERACFRDETDPSFAMNGYFHDQMPALAVQSTFTTVMAFKR